MNIGFSKLTAGDGTADGTPAGSKVQPVEATRQTLAASKRHISAGPDEEIEICVPPAGRPGGVVSQELAVPARAA
jgi:hypothetical protein